MKVILRKNVEKLGKIGEVVNVADGYARNYLLPKKFAMNVTEGSLKAIEKEQQAQARKEEKLKKELKSLASKLQAKSYTVTKKSGEEDKLFGSVTTNDIAEALAEEDFKIDKKKIVLEEAIGKLGVYNVKIKLGLEINAEIKLWVVKE